MKKILLYLLMNIVCIIDLLCLSKAFEYAETNINSSNVDNMASLLFWPILFNVIIATVVIINLLLGIMGVLFLKNNNISLKDLLYTKSDVLKFINIIGYIFIIFFFIFLYNELGNSNYYGVIFCVLAIINIMIYITWIKAIIKGILKRLSR